MIVKIIDYEKQETREHDTQFLSMSAYVKINFCMWGFYKVVRVGNAYEIYNTFENNKLCYKVVKA